MHSACYSACYCSKFDDGISHIHRSGIRINPIKKSLVTFRVVRQLGVRPWSSSSFSVVVPVVTAGAVPQGLRLVAVGVVHMAVAVAYQLAPEADRVPAEGRAAALGAAHDAGGVERIELAELQRGMWTS